MATSKHETGESVSQDSHLPAHKIYHQRQSRQLCALHALNNLFQDPQAFTQRDLDKICKELSPQSRLFNPHKSNLGLGCYDVNVIIAALAKKKLDVKWFDKRKDLSCLELDDAFGLILNVPNSRQSGLLAPLSYLTQVWSSQKHWVAIKKIETHYFNLDSKLDSPLLIGDDKALIQYLCEENYLDQVEILVVQRHKD